MNKDYIITATLTVAFGMEDKPSEEEVQEHFLEWIGSASDGFILEGTEIEIEDPMTPNQIVAKNLKRLRIAKGMTQAEACKLTGLGWSSATWSSVESSVKGKRIKHFDADTLTSLAEFYDVSVADLLEL